MLKNIIKGVLFLIFFSFFFLLAQKSDVKAETCSPAGSSCGYACNTYCPGYCNYAVSKLECEARDFTCCWSNTCRYGQLCHCHPVVQYYLCTWDSTCVENKCDEPECTNWGPWGPCIGGVQYRYCQTVNNDTRDERSCDPNDPDDPDDPAPNNCTVSLSLQDNFTLGLGKSKPIVANVNANGNVSRVLFSSSNPARVSVNPDIDNSDPYKTTLTALSIFEQGATIRARVVMGNEVRCSDSITVIVPTPSCNVNLPSDFNLRLGNTKTITAETSVLNADLSLVQVRFASINSNKVSVNPDLDNSDPYKTTLTALSIFEQGATIRARVIIEGVEYCRDEVVVVVTSPLAWWQVKDSDVFSNDNITSIISSGCILPTCNPSFGLDGPGGFPGIPIYRNTFNLGNNANASISSTNWNANTATVFQERYNYLYFEKQIPDDITINEILSNEIPGTYFTSPETQGISSNGIYWYRYNNPSEDLTITSNTDIGGRKVVLLINGSNLNINGKINLNDAAQGFFMTIVGKNVNGAKGNIYINGNVGGAADTIPDLEGIYLSENSIYTGEGNQQLHVRGMLIGYNGINLQRDLVEDNLNTPAEFIEYAPDQFILMPKNLRVQKTSWKEIQP